MRIFRGDLTFKGGNGGTDRITFIDGVMAFIAGAFSLAGTVLTATGAEVNLTDNAIASVTWATPAAGAANICKFGGTIKDAAGATIAECRVLDVYLSTSSAGVGVSATSYSTGAAVTGGSLIGTIAANKAFKVQTAADGTFEISITATGKPATEYAVALMPISRSAVVSAASGTHYG